jgi:predicted transcriptional regulator
VLPFVEHLRELWARCGLTSADLADQLGISASSLSRYLSGERHPGPETVNRLHDLVGECTGTPLTTEERKAARELMWTAARAQGPLVSREMELAVAGERLRIQQEETRRIIAELNTELAAERQRRQEAEESLRDLRRSAEQEAEQTREQMESLTAELDQATAQITELESRLSQYQAYLRMLETDEQRFLEMRHEVATQIASLDAETPETMNWSGADAIARFVISLRNSGQVEYANKIITKAAVQTELQTFIDLISILINMGREKERNRLVSAAAQRWSYARLQSVFMEPEETGSFPSALRNGLLWAVGESRPVAEVALLITTLAEVSFYEKRVKILISAAATRGDSRDIEERLTQLGARKEAGQLYDEAVDMVNRQPF